MSWGARQAELFGLWQSTKPVTALLRGPKGGGKTQAGIWTLLRWAKANHRHRQIGIATPSLKQFRNAVMPAVRSWCKVTGNRIKSHADGFEVAGNVFVRCIGRDHASLASILSLNLVGAYVCEFNEQPPEFVDELVFSRVRVTGRRLVLMDYNPKGTAHWAEVEYWDRADDLSMMRFQFTLDDNPGLPADWVEAQHAKWLPGTSRHRRYVLGLPADDEGRVYKFIYDGDPPAKEPDLLFAGVDAGNSLDHPSHALLLGEWPEGVFVLDEWRHPTSVSDDRLTPDQHAADMTDRFAAWGRVAAWAVDPAALYMIHALQRVGQKAEAADNRKIAGIEITDSYLTRAIMRVSDARSPWLHRELLNYVWDTRQDGYERERHPVGEDDHGPDALRYAAMWRNANRAAAAGRRRMAAEMTPAMRAAARWTEG